MKVVIGTANFLKRYGLKIKYQNEISLDKTLGKKYEFDDNLSNVACLCENWEEFVIEIEEWGIYKLGGVDFDTLTPADIVRLDEFIFAENGYIREEV